MNTINKSEVDVIKKVSEVTSLSDLYILIDETLDRNLEDYDPLIGKIGDQLLETGKYEGNFDKVFTYKGAEYDLEGFYLEDDRLYIGGLA